MPRSDDVGKTTSIFCEGFDVTGSQVSQKRSQALIELSDLIRDTADPDELAYDSAMILG